MAYPKNDLTQIAARNNDLVAAKSNLEQLNSMKETNELLNGESLSGLKIKLDNFEVRMNIIEEKMNIKENEAKFGELYEFFVFIFFLCHHFSSR